MFSKLKDKLKAWTEKFSKEEPAEIKEKPKKEKEGKKKKPREISLPMKFEPGLQKYEPDLEKLEEIKEEIKKEEKTEEKPSTDSFFKKVTSKILKIEISEKEFEIYSEDLEMLLLENNVALEVAEEIINKLKDKIVGTSFLKKEIEWQIKEALKEIIEEILIEPFSIPEKIKNREDKSRPYVILFCGVNGTGKTTSIAKIADYLKKQKISSVVSASDTFRAASIEQLKTHAEKIGIKIISHEYGSDPAAVGFDAVKYAKKNHIDCVLIDTAGRMHTARNLLKEIEKISRVCNPDLKLFVGESITGNDAIEQVKSFNWSIGIDGIILTKADIDEKGGTALSVGFVTKKPILFLGTGQEYEKIEVFDKKKFIEKLGL
ncbi:signal recognition particle-docking protein FtsY [Candidatus Pacearchaeota archaeon CG10_big_fil_rev_8_21_14_0_10_34_12]|nr:MAG: signal recognition particle-docking protein FtsY [Candidatus Pacearchaeota archaeon CG10_big_fil_rev_8_21_14_0_10_34_12]